MQWMNAEESKPTPFWTVVLWVTGSEIHCGEDYLDVGIWNDQRGKWQASIGPGYIDVEVSHWMDVVPPPGVVRAGSFAKEGTPC